MTRRGREIAEGRPEGEGGKNGRPVEELPRGARDRVNRDRSLYAVPESEQDDQGEPEAERGDEVGNEQDHVGDVGRHGAKDGDHDDRAPVGVGLVVTPRPLPGESRAEGDESEENREGRVEPVDEKVGERLTHRRRPQLNHPEGEVDLRDLYSVAVVASVTCSHWAPV